MMEKIKWVLKKVLIGIAIFYGILYVTAWL